MRKNILFAIITVLVFLVISDVALRLVFGPPPSRPFEWPPPEMTKHGLTGDAERFWKLRPGYDEPWRLYKLAYTSELAANKAIDFDARNSIVAPLYEGVRWEVNDQGFRGRPVPAEKIPGTKRLVFLGSSVTFGWGVPAHRAFPELIRQELENAFPGTAFDVLNAGVPGYSSFQGLRYLKRILPKYEPDVVVAEFGINDGTMAVGRADKDWRPGLWDPARRILRNSGWARLVLKVFGASIAKPRIVDVLQNKEQALAGFYRVSATGHRTRVAPEDFTANLEAMAALCEEHGALFFFWIPCLFHEYGEDDLMPAVKILTPRTIPVFDIFRDVAPQEWESLFLPYDEGHLSRAGHKLAARGMVEFLKPRIAARL